MFGHARKNKTLKIYFAKKNNDFRRWPTTLSETGVHAMQVFCIFLFSECQGGNHCETVHEHTSHASAILTQNGLKRSNSSLFPTKRLRRPHSNGHNFSPQNVDAFISSLQRQFVDMSIEILRPCGNSAVLKITLSRTMRALVCLRGLIIEWVLVKAFNEDFYTDDDQLDMWSKSRYRVFHKVTEHANAAMLHFFSPQLPDLAVKSFLQTWLHSYLHLFSAFCRRCGTRLQHSMPPTWRDLRNLDVYHETCRP
ncbi:mediator of RNA polymerase II transcription subunit 27 isoform X3 [Rhipicephalus microplus]|uniref:mediator of RNA polymerase II transcription subunit 27 isoform X3 n=1 Tax=Rhipicephalus microplus TaxID=6941 RepID=UPI003F6D5DAD